MPVLLVRKPGPVSGEHSPTCNIPHNRAHCEFAAHRIECCNDAACGRVRMTVHSLNNPKIEVDRCSAVAASTPVFAASAKEGDVKPDPLKWAKDFLAGGTAGNRHLFCLIWSTTCSLAFAAVHPRQRFTSLADPAVTLFGSRAAWLHTWLARHTMLLVCRCRL